MLQLWLATDDSPTQTARALYAASSTAALLRRPVELALRDSEGVRFRRFDANGEPAGTPGTDERGDEELDGGGPSSAGPSRAVQRGSGPNDSVDDAGWRAVRNQMRTLEEAARAEHAAYTREGRLRGRMTAAERVLTEAEPPVRQAERDRDDAHAAADTAAGELAAAERAVTLAERNDEERRARVTQLTTEAQAQDERVTDATRTAGEYHDAVRTAEEELAAAERAVRQAEEAARQRPANSHSDDAGSPDRPEARWNRASTTLDQARIEAAAADRAVDTARHAANDTRRRLGLAEDVARHAAGVLTGARDRAATATTAHDAAQAALGTATAHHDQMAAARNEAQAAVDALERQIINSLAVQARQASRQRNAERDLADVVTVLETQRAAEGEGTALLTTGSVAATPATWPRRTPRPTPAAAEPAVDPQEQPEGEPQVAPQEPEFQPVDAGNGTDEEPEDDQANRHGQGDQHGLHGQELDSGGESGDARYRPVVSRAQRPETFARSLAQLLADAGADTAPAWTRDPDPHGALFAWVQADVAANGAPDDPRFPAPGSEVSTDALAHIGALTEELRAQAILQNGMVTVAEAGLDDSARLALVLADPDNPFYVATLAALVVRDTGRPVQVIGPGDRTHRFGPADGTPLTLYFDGNRFSVNPPAPDDD
jgi:hypothetical protein